MRRGMCDSDCKLRNEPEAKTKNIATMKITIQVNESGIRSKNIDISDAESWVAGNGRFADEAKALLAFVGQEGIPESFKDSDGDQWLKVGESANEEGEFYTYELA